jgi:FAD binding domain/Aromatic-ring hydroxylase, C-terminal
VRSVVGADIDVEVLAIDPWSARMLLVDHYRGQRTFLVGDAAHLNPPWGGHGFNTCVGDAVNIGWKLAAVLQGWAPPSLLDTYEIERRPVAERTIAAAANQEAFLAPSFATADLDADDDAGIQLRAELARRLEVKHSEFHSLGLVLGYDYRDSSVVVADGQPLPEPKLDTFVPSAHPGARLPHAWLPDGSSIYDHLGEGFTVLRMSPHRDATPLLDAAQRQSVPLTLLDLSFTPQLRQSYGADLLLIRPDQHIAWRGSRIEDPDVLVTRVIASRPTEEER